MSKRTNHHVVVITGASSGIGRETALEFALRGASVVLAARNELALREVAHEVERLGGQAAAVVTDVASWPEMEQLARKAVERFGRIDTWVNNAAVTEYASVEQVAIDEIERIVQVDLMGQISGVKAALPYLIRQRRGTIVNVAAVAARQPVPLQAPYCAAMAGIVAFTESLRLELAREHPGIGVTLILPASIDTPLFAHARSKLGVFPRPLAPVYEPRTVAHAIVFAAEHRRRRIVVGGPTLPLTLLEALSPRLVEWYRIRTGWGFQDQETDWPDDGQDNLFAPMPGTGRAAGRFGARSTSISLYTRHVGLYPARARAIVAALVVTMLALTRRARG